MQKLPPKFTMPFEPTTIEHLGLKLYAYLPPVIGELVSNAWDADADKIEVTLPVGRITEASEVTVRDYGKYSGMDAAALQREYLPIGRNRREASGDRTLGEKRPLMGRKGIGKLSAFGVASELEIRTVKDRFAICIRLDYEKMKSWSRGKPYEPEIVQDRCGNTKDPNGTEVCLRKLYRRSPIDIDSIRKGLARRFTVIGNDFAVMLNGTPITYEDRRLKEKCKKSWDAKELPDEGIVDRTRDWRVQGWIGLVEKASQTERGVDVFARGKAVELDTTFELETTHIQWARAYVVGEIHAAFLDAEEDNISTGRNSVHWESEAGQKLKEWGQKALKFVHEEWLELQHKEKEERIFKVAGFQEWLSKRSPREQRVTQKLIDALVKSPSIDPESLEPLLEIVKTNVEFEAFRELVDEMEESGVNVQTFLRLVEDWRIVESRMHLQLSDGRLEVMEKLSDHVKKGALEVKHIQPLFEENGWLVDPTWGNVTGQTSYTKLLRKHCSEPKDLPEIDRRIDILGYDAGGSVHVVELKRPGKTLSRKDLEQIEEYVDWARKNIITTGADSPRYIAGLLIVGKLSSEGTIQEKMVRLAGSDIRVKTYDDLLARAKKIYGEVERQLKHVAPEYSRDARHRRKRSVP